MKKTSMFLLAAFIALGACTNYTPSKANCFGFVARGPAAQSCDFIPLDNPSFDEGGVTGA